jgi:hypothetical protein
MSCRFQRKDRYPDEAFACSVRLRAELKELRDMPVAIRANVATLKTQGRSRDETVAAKPTAAFDAKWGNVVIDPGFFTRLVYEGV